MNNMNEVRTWFERAKRDFKAAKVNFKEKLYDVSAFLLHQSLEKGLKALYLKKFKELIKTHNLIFLGRQAKIPKEFLEICDKVNSFYIESRYPPLFVVEKYTKENISPLIKEVKKVLEWIEKRL